MPFIAAALRRERERLGISLAELARRAGIAKSTLSQLEASTGNPSVETLWALAVALGVPFSRLVEQPAPAVRVIRAGDGPRLRSAYADFNVNILLRERPARPARHLSDRTDRNRAVAGRRRHIRRAVLEHLIVASGRLRVGAGERSGRVEPGDYVTFAATCHTATRRWHRAPSPCW